MDHGDRIVGHYERHAAHWDADRRNAGWNDRKWHDRFVALLHEGAAGPAYGIALGSYRGDPLYHASLDAEDYRMLLARHDFELIDHAIEDAEAGGRTVWLGRRA